MTPAPIFIIAAARSGTTWLVRALNAHPEVYATEIRGFGDYVDVVHDDGVAKPRLRITLDKYVDALLQPHQWGPLGTRDAVRDELLQEIYGSIARHALRRSGKRLFVDKLTPYPGTAVEAMTTIARSFPDAKVLLLIRDGRDMAVSWVMHWFAKRLAGDQLTEHQRLRQAFFRDGADTPPARFFTDEEIERHASYWREVLDAVATCAAGLQTLVVRYEDMSRDFARELRRMYEFIGADASDAVLDRCVGESTFEVMSGGRQRGEDAPGQHVRKGVVGDWRIYFTAADARLFDQLAGQRLIEQGYEPDRGWIARAPERLQLDQAIAAPRI